MEPTALPDTPTLDPRFLALAGTTAGLVSLHDVDGRCLFASPMTRELLGAEPDDLIGRDWSELVPGEDDDPFAARGELRVRHRLLRPYGPPLVCETSVTPVEEGGRLIQLLCVTQGLDAGGWQLPDSLRDRLTGLPTRDVLVDRLGALLAEGRTAVAALVIDLDHLNAISARFGQEAGDRVLAETARRVQEMLRPTDLLGRLEGDSLCALCIGVRDYGAATRIAERVRAVVARPLPFEPVMATASVGAALGSSGGDSEAVLRLAAGAALAVRRRGGNAAELHG
jgi:diguanylate cyclase (GGDEF)-like protein/PAS domain S-box-containing protein